jgi:hypothetical protein
MTERSIPVAVTIAARVTLALACCGLLGWAQADPRFTIGADGTEVTDNRTGLVWRRCSAGQSFSGGTCTGEAATYTHEQALAYARGQAGWRLPNVKELSSIVDTDRYGPAIDVAAFPGTPADPYSWYWSSSARASDPASPWGVDFRVGGFRVFSRGSGNHVRLVR